MTLIHQFTNLEGPLDISEGDEAALVGLPPHEPLAGGEHGEECSGEKYFTDEAVLNKWVGNDEKTVKWIFTQLKAPSYCAASPTVSCCWAGY